jgi:hypothetical protein
MGGWKRKYDEELHTLHSSPNNVLQIKAGEMDVMWQMSETHKNLTGQSKTKKQLEDMCR